jgi:hypothetical protein
VNPRRISSSLNGCTHELNGPSGTSGYLAWITRHRRTVRDYERLPAHHETYVYWAMIIIMTRRLARPPKGGTTSPQAT